MLVENKLWKKKKKIEKIEWKRKPLPLKVNNVCTNIKYGFIIFL